ncbi:B3/4 domain-containing protein [Parabacteroides sp. FAFU027]|uniref:B3/B4 domain-containing protein n=1 Tax=Parabacteroides sp. FAFU027 TaxID=2922715 RepID=UPI001FAFCC30|nr:phenylalanine--tRNA ligase beta subunit-related protein [Parabacteroides sp. FAFU027]
MISITLSESIRTACPRFAGIAISCNVHNTEECTPLWEEIEAFENELSQSLKIEQVNKIPTIAATRQAYKALGKDPNRYRPSAEALHRRLLRGLGLYKINTLVDLINLVSLRTGYSIGGFDADRVVGNLTFGVGEAEEMFEGIGRGLLNIEGLPVYRDELGGIGTPTSDEERTKISPGTTKLLMLINGFSGKEGLNEAAGFAVDLLQRYAFAENIQLLEY